MTTISAPTSTRQRQRRTTSARRIIGLLIVAVLLALGLGGAFTAPTPAEAAGRVSVSGTPKADSESTLELSGSGFQSVQNGFGGIYVLFGWVDDPSGGWRPSQGGVTGTNYRYVYDDETNPTGYQVFVTFPGSSTAGAANGGEVAANGTWSANIKVPGATFTSYDRAQNEVEVDCTQVQCGIITVGAHGVVNANNESFTPVDFSGTSGEAEEGRPADEGEEKDEKPSEEERPDEAPTTGGSGESTVSEPTADPAVAPVTSQPLVDGSWVIFFAILAAVAVIGAIIAIGLGFGIGGYLAAKSLLLGVSPAALEKERARRERKRIRTKHRLDRRRLKMERRKKLELAKLERSSEKAIAHTAHQGANANSGALPAQVIAFFEGEDRKRAEATPPTDGTLVDGSDGSHLGASTADDVDSAAVDPEHWKDTRVLARVSAETKEDEQ